MTRLELTIGMPTLEAWAAIGRFLIDGFRHAWDDANEDTMRTTAAEIGFEFSSRAQFLEEFDRIAKARLDDCKRWTTTEMELRRCMSMFGNSHGFRSLEPMHAMLAMTTWVRAGLQKIEMSHTYAAALLVSTLTDEVVAAIKPPWPSFVLDVPDNLIFISRSFDDSEPVAVSKVLVEAMEDGEGIKWLLSICSSRFDDSDISTVRVLDLRDPKLITGVSGNPITGIDKRGVELCARLVLGVCAAITIPGELKPKKVASVVSRLQKSSKKKTKIGNSAINTYILGQPIDLDFRHRIRAYNLTGDYGTEKGPKLEVRTMVRGHFKLVWYGQGWAQSKTKWIQPYWKGPDVGPIVVRPHVIKTDSDLPS